MRATAILLATLGSLAACASRAPLATQEVATTAPSVSYQIYGNDVMQANVRADAYCQQYGMYANLQGIQPNGPQSLATYTCAGSRVSNAAPPYYGNPAPYAAPPPYTAAAPYYNSNTATTTSVVRCADPLHQDLPGGTDYPGPPVAGCP